MYLPGIDFLFHRLWRRWVLRGRRRTAELQGGSWVLCHNARYRLSFFVMAAIFCTTYIGLFVLNPESIADEPKWQQVGLHLFALGMAVFTLAALWASIYDSAVVSSQGLSSRSAIGPGRQCTWAEIQSLSESGNGEKLLVQLNSMQKPIKINLFFHGLGTLYDYITDYVPPENRAGADSLLGVGVE